MVPNISLVLSITKPVGPFALKLHTLCRFNAAVLPMARNPNVLLTLLKSTTRVKRSIQLRTSTTPLPFSGHYGLRTELRFNDIPIFVLASLPICATLWCPGKALRWFRKHRPLAGV